MSEKYEYNYKALTPEEKKMVMDIKNQYAEKPKKEANKVDKLVALDKKVKSIPIAISLTFGIIGTSLFALGMILVLHYNEILNGAIIGVIGIILFSVAYPIYSFIYNKRKDKYKKEIIELSDEILKD